MRLPVVRGFRSRGLACALLLAVAFASGACRTAYYAAWEKLGSEKRDLLRRDVDRVKEQQETTAAQFQDALAQLRALYGSSGSDLEQRYDATKAEYQDCEGAAETLRGRIGDVRRVASDLFEEWKGEIESMQSASLKRSSRAKLESTQDRFRKLDAAMTRSEESLEPVLTQFRDQVLYLKHNLNAQALGRLEVEVRDIDQGVAGLIERMRRSTQEADAFLGTLEGGA